MQTIVYNGKKAQHLAVPAYAPASATADKKGKNTSIKGYLVNMADKRVSFYPENEIVVLPAHTQTTQTKTRLKK